MLWAPGVAGEGDRSSPAQGTWLGPDGPPGSSLLHTPPSSPGPWVASISLLWSHQFSGRTAHQSLHSQADPPFPPGPGVFLASPPLHCSAPSPFTASQGTERSPHGRIGVTLVLGIVLELSLLSTARSLPEGGCQQRLHLLPAAP